MFTAVIGGTSGDPSAAAKLMQNLIETSTKNIKFTWIISKDKCSLQIDVKKFIENADGTPNPNIKLVDLPGDQLNLETRGSDIIHTLQKANTIFIYPTVNFSDKDIEFLQTLNKTMIAINEYDNRIVLEEKLKEQNLNCRYYQTGLGLGSKGIFIQDPATSQESIPLSSKDDFRLLFNVDNDPNAHDYLSSHRLFLGYFSNEQNVNYQSLVDRYTFIIVCIKKALFNPSNATHKPNLDLLINVDNKTVEVLVTLMRENRFLLNPEEAKQLTRFVHPKRASHFLLNQAELQQLSGSIEYIDKTGTSKTLILNEDHHKNSNGIKVRIINCFPLKKTSMEWLMQNAEPPLGLTGDQSFVEGLMQGKPVYYEIMKWKEPFFQAFTTYCEYVLGSKSELYNFYTAQLYKGALKEHQKAEEKLANFYCENELKLWEQSQLLSNRLRRDKDIKNLLIPELLHEIEQTSMESYFKKFGTQR